jgi:RNA polymerase sigma-70 factor (ECF subfamily)
MSHLRLVSSRRSAEPESAGQTSHPCLEAFQLEFDYLIRTLRRLGVSRDEVEDMAHEVFLVLYRTWNKYDTTRPFRAYLFGIAFRVACAHVRKRRREIPYAVMEINDAKLRPDQALEADQQRALVLKALEQVPIERRAVLVMHDIDGLRMDEIASNLSIYRFTGYSRLRKARKEFAAAVTSLRGGPIP